MEYSVYMTEMFEDEISGLSDSDKNVINKIFRQLKENPYVGDVIKYKFFREKRLREKRIYYLVYDDLSCVLIVAFGGKKVQQKIIDEIIDSLPEFRKYVKKLKEN